jgi:hypothetical protein
VIAPGQDHGTGGRAFGFEAPEHSPPPVLQVDDDGHRLVPAESVAEQPDCPVCSEMMYQGESAEWQCLDGKCAHTEPPEFADEGRLYNVRR